MTVLHSLVLHVTVWQNVTLCTNMLCSHITESYIIILSDGRKWRLTLTYVKMCIYEFLIELVLNTVKQILLRSPRLITCLPLPICS